MAEDVLYLLLTCPRVAREVAHVVRDLRPRGSHEVLEHVGDERALLRRRASSARSRCRRTIVSAPPKPLERHEPHRAGASSCSTSQRRSSTSWRNGASTRPDSSCPGTTPRPLEPVLDPPRCNLVEHRLDELGLGAYGSSSGASSL